MDDRGTTPDDEDARLSTRAATYASLLCITGLIASGMLAQHQAVANRELTQQRLNTAAERLSDQLIERMQKYAYAVRDASSAIVVMGETPRRETFRDFTESRDFAREFPGSRGFGFVRRVRPQDEAAFLAAARADGMPDFSIRTLTPHGGDRYVTQYIEPLEQNLEALGLDLASDIPRRAAARAALESGEPTLSEPITLVQALNRPKQGFLLMLAIHSPRSPVDSLAEREAATYGWAYAPLVIDEVLQDFGLEQSPLTVKLTDITMAAAPRVFYGADTEPAEHAVRLERHLLGRAWEIEARPKPHFISELNLLTPNRVFGLGALTTCLGAGLLFLLCLSIDRAKQVERQRGQLLTIIEGSNDAIISLTHAGHISTWNPAAERIFGYSAALALGERLDELLGVGSDLVSGPLSPSPFDATLRTSTGAEVDVSIALSTIRTAGQAVGTGVIIRDISARKAAERELSQFNAKLEQQVSDRAQQLEAARRHLQLILDAMPSVIGYWDRSLTNRFGNHAYRTWFGIAPDALPGKHMREVLGDELFEDNRVFIEAALRGEPQMFERAIPNKRSGGIRHSLTHYLPDVVAGEVRGFYVLAHDVSDLAQSRRELAEVVRENDALLKTLDRLALVSMTDAQGKITYANEAFCEVSGYTLQELLGQDHRIVNSGAHSRSFWRNVWASLRNGIPWRGELCNRKKDGSLYWVDSIIAPYLDASGKIERFISIRTEITAIKAAERAHARERDRLDNILRSTGVGTWEWQLQTGELFINERCATMLGYELKDVSPVKRDMWSSRIHPEDADAAKERVEKHLNGETDSYEAEFRMQHRDGRWLWMAVHGQIISCSADGSPEWMYGIQQDVTARHEAHEALLKAMREAEAANAAKSEFLANMSHEIRTPLSAVIGLAHLLERSALEPEQRGHVEKIQLAGRSLLAVINDVLDLSKIEAGELTLDEAQLDLFALVSELEELLAPQAHAKGLQFSVHRSAELPRRVLGDVTRLRQMLLNLLSNAIKFTTQGSVGLRLSCTSTGPQQILLRCAVRDTGVGIAPEAQGRLFSPFTQADTSTTRNYGGTGLGLSIVRRLAELMGGKVGLVSAPGSGSEFWIEVPCRLAGTLLEESFSTLGAFQVLVAAAQTQDREAVASLARELGLRVEALSSVGALTRRLSTPHSSGAPVQALIVDADLYGAELQASLAALSSDDAGSNPAPALILLDAPGTDGAQLRRPLTAANLFNAINSAVIADMLSHEIFTRSVRLDALQSELLVDVRILVVDDSVINLEIAKRILLHEGARVQTVANGHAALDALGANADAFDVVLMDVQMPGIDGLETTRQLRRIAGLSTLPVIALTAGALVAEKQRALDAGMDAFVSKPFEPLGLVQVVRRQVERSRRSPLHVRERADAPRRAPALPHMEGIDRGLVAAPLRNNLAQFGALLRIMLEEFADLIDEPAPSLSEPSVRAQYAARVHKLRGSAGLLGAMKVHRHASAAEVALKAQTPSERVLTILKPLAAALAELRDHALPVLGELSPAPPTGAAALEPAEVRELMALLRDQDMRAQARFQQLSAALSGNLGDEAFSQLRRAIESFSFAEALDLLKQRFPEDPELRAAADR